MCLPFGESLKEMRRSFLTNCVSRTSFRSTGKVDARLEDRWHVDTVNERSRDRCQVEIVTEKLELKIVNKSAVLPFQLDKELSNEDLRMKYRYLDLRRPRMTRNMQPAPPCLQGDPRLS